MCIQSGKGISFAQSKDYNQGKASMEEIHSEQHQATNGFLQCLVNNIAYRYNCTL